MNLLFLSITVGLASFAMAEVSSGVWLPNMVIGSTSSSSFGQKPSGASKLLMFQLSEIDGSSIERQDAENPALADYFNDAIESEDNLFEQQGLIGKPPKTRRPPPRTRGPVTRRPRTTQKPPGGMTIIVNLPPGFPSNQPTNPQIPSGETVPQDGEETTVEPVDNQESLVRKESKAKPPRGPKTRRPPPRTKKPVTRSPKTTKKPSDGNGGLPDIIINFPQPDGQNPETVPEDVTAEPQDNQESLVQKESKAKPPKGPKTRRPPPRTKKPVTRSPKTTKKPSDGNGGLPDIIINLPQPDGQNPETVPEDVTAEPQNDQGSLVRKESKARPPRGPKTRRPPPRTKKPVTRSPKTTKKPSDGNGGLPDIIINLPQPDGQNPETVPEDVTAEPQNDQESLVRKESKAKPPKGPKTRRPPPRTKKPVTRSPKTTKKPSDGNGGLPDIIINVPQPDGQNPDTVPEDVTAEPQHKRKNAWASDYSPFY